MRQPTSMPARSLIANGPIGKPNSTAAASTSRGNAPSNNSRSAWFWRGDSMRLPTKPWQTPTTTGTLPILRPTAIAVASTSGAVSLPRTISKSFITLAGLKKCVPSTSFGRLVICAI